VITQEAVPVESEYVEYVQSEEIEVSVYVSCTQSLELVVSDQAGTLIVAA
jgi:hypothetical protein